MNLLAFGLPELYLTGAMALVVAGMIFLIFRKTDADKEYEANLEESLNDSKIYDPETDTYITLEEAELGMWDVHKDGLSQNSLEREIRLAYEKEGFKRWNDSLNEEDFNVLDNFALLKNDDTWTYDGYFTMDDVVSPLLKVHDEIYLTLWFPLSENYGHYVFTPKTGVERFFDSLRKDDDFHSNHYECHTFKKGMRHKPIEAILKMAERYDTIQFELLKKNSS